MQCTTPHLIVPNLQEKHKLIKTKLKMWGAQGLWRPSGLVAVMKVTLTYLVIIFEDAAEIEETCRSKVSWDLLGLSCAGDVLHLRTVHHAQTSRDLKGAWSLGLVLGLRRQTRGLGCLVRGLFWGLLLSIKGHKHRLLLLLLLRLLLLSKGIVRPWWLHTMGDSGRWG